MASSKLFLPAGTCATDEYDLEITPQSADWGFSSLRILTLPSNGTHTFDTGPDEIVVLPLSGSATVEVDRAFVDLDGRADVFAGPTDFAYLPIRSHATISSHAGGRFALTGARTDRVLPFRYGPAQKVPVELRGAGQSSRQVRNFATPDAFDAAAIIACEVVTPGGNWSSYPAHKHDETTETEAELEEIYYFEIAAGPAGLRLPPHVLLAGQEDRHPRGGARQGHRAGSVRLARALRRRAGSRHVLPQRHGRSGERAWRISDHPDQGWIRGTWADQDVDPRLIAENMNTISRPREGN